ncbi:MAG: hypothetical protein U0263_11305 [Polyangiaceae bacterium]
MTEPTRLSTDGASPFERELLDSWKSEQPSSAARRRALALAGAGALATLGAASTAEAATPAVAKASLFALAGKWLGVGAALGLVASAASYAVFEPSRGEVPRNGAEASPSETPRRATATPPPELTASAFVPPETRPPPAPVGPTAQRAERATSPATEDVTPAEPARSSLGAQIAELDRARNALRGGSPARALELVADYQKKYPSGALAQDAEVLRIDALDRLGRRDEATQGAKRFTEAHPESAHAERLRQLSGAKTNP